MAIPAPVFFLALSLRLQLLLHVFQQHCVGGDRNRTPGHGQRSYFRSEQQTQRVVQHAGRNRKSDHVINRRPDQILLHLPDRGFREANRRQHTERIAALSTQARIPQNVFSCASATTQNQRLCLIGETKEQTGQGGASMELSTFLVSIGLVMLQLLVIAILSYCCLTLPFRKKQEHVPPRPVLRRKRRHSWDG